MKICKKLIVSLCVMCSVASSFFIFGCTPKNKGLITLDVYSQIANYDGEQKGFWGTLLADKFGVKLNIISDIGGVYSTRMESGHLGDIVVWGTNGPQYQEAVTKGMLFDWEDENLLENYGKDIKNTFPTALESNRDINKGIVNDSTNGKIYGIGHGLALSEEDHEAFFYSWDTRWDLYKQLGYPEIKDLDDYIDLMENMKKINPTDDNGNPTYAYSLWKDWDDNMVMYVKAMASAYYGYDELGLGLYDAENKVYHPTLEKDGPYLEMLRYFNTLNRKGLIDPDSSTQDYNKMSAKVRSGGAFSSIFNYTGYLAYNTQKHLSDGKMMAALVPEEAKVITYGMNPYGGNRIWSIGARSQYPELAMEVINFLATADGSMPIWHGLEGVHWNYVDGGGMAFTEFGRLCRDDRKTMQAGKQWVSPYTGKTYDLSGTFEDGELKIGNILWAFDAVNPDSRAGGERFNHEFWESEQGDSRYEIGQDWISKMGVSNRQDYLENRKDPKNADAKGYTIIPAVNYGEGQKGTLSTSWSKVIDTIKTSSWNAIMAGSETAFELIVDGMIKKANQEGYADCVTWSQNEVIKKFGS